MLDLFRKKISITVFVTISFMSIALCGSGCAGDYIEYVPLDPGLIGKKIHFKEPMVYLVFSDEKIAKKYGFIYPEFKGKKIIRDLVSKYTASNFLIYIPNLHIESIKTGMDFTIISNYWVRHSKIKREFAPEYRKLILCDEDNIYSVYMISGDNIIDSLISNTDFGD